MSTVNNKKVSIIIPLYNQASKVLECLDSIIDQTYKNYEVIIVNDGSTDSPEEKMKKGNRKFDNLKIISQSNQGAAQARNNGFNIASGEYVLFCDADIILENTMLEKMVNILEENSNISYVYSSFYWGKKLFKLFEFSGEKLKSMPFIHTTSLIRRKDFPGFDPSLKKFQDWDLWITMLFNGHVGRWIPQVLFKVETGGTMSSWIPKIFYKYFPFLPQVKKYNQALKIIKIKHNL